MKKSADLPKQLQKCLTGIKGFDEITEGGLPKNRTTLVSGSTGSGKTLFGIDFLINGAIKFKEPGVFMSFEETEDQLYEDVASLNLDLKGLVSQKKILIEHVILERKDIQELDFNLEGLFVRLEHAIDSIGAKRIVLDSIESLFAGIANDGILRLEIKRLFRWLKEKQVTAIVTGEPMQEFYTRHGLEQYISDCIILLDNRVKDQIAIRRIRVVKYRGSKHGTNEYPFVIDKDGLSVIPITSAGLDQPGTAMKVSTGIPSLDKLFKGGKPGYTMGSTVLASGTAGTGKTSLATAFAIASCKRGERCLFLSYEESAGQLTQNMSSIGFHLEPMIKKGLLKIVSTRPSFFGLEMHLLDLYKLIAEFKPKIVVIDPLTSLIGEGDQREIRSMITRMIDLLKSHGITSFFTSLVSSAAQNDTSGEIGVSSLIDTWIVVRELEEDVSKKRIRGLFIVKSRGTGHDSDVHKLILSDDGIKLVPMGGESIVGANEEKKIGKNVSEGQKLIKKDKGE
ncbi:circadian clock protein KaiC [Mucilaginibacter sp. 5C4]|uniref:circadian clock protein KaiC n=1 Tax=Mucilaginibacter sp. 5C4 TaxID=3048589 RepID=UPI002AC9AECE|nr:circadian clock protein KaiC [Mucilaginibacter sp. 5C4]MEB0302826.1 circadian clock protein KaiC [Mucilaginibacter sp. 5C4]WPX24112.1 circadian clock protein KaiC [Mucilaginibacter sp. 5C4]